MHIDLEDTAGVACLFFGLFLVAFGLYSRVIKNFYLSEPLLSTLFGILLGPRGLGVLRLVPAHWDAGLADDEARLTLAWLCRVIIGVQVLFAASTLPSRYLLVRENVQTMAVLMLPVMTAGFLVSGALVKLCLPTTFIAEALVIGAAISPTDPVLANSIVKGIFAERHVPRHVRELLAAESGLNDGFGTPFLFVPLFAILDNYRLGSTVRDFILYTVLRDVLFGSALGVGTGYVARKALKLARRHDTIDRESMLVFSVSLALFTLGLANLLHTNELLACFFAGTAVNWTDKIRAEDLHSHFSEGVELVFDTAVFLLLGTVLPFDTWADPDLLPPRRLLLLAVLVLLFRRLPAVLACYKITPQLHTVKEAIFVGWFGPIGVGAVYYALVATEKLPEEYEGRKTVIATVTFIVFCSIIVHGTSAPLIMLAQTIPSRFAADISKAQAQVPDASGPSAESTGVSETSPLIRAPINSRRKSLFERSSDADIDRDELDRILAQRSDDSADEVDDAPPDTGSRVRRPRDASASARSDGRAYPAMGDPETHRHRQRVRGAVRDVEAGDVGQDGEERDAPSIAVYDEGTHVVLEDGEGGVTVRKVGGRSRSRVRR